MTRLQIWQCKCHSMTSSHHICLILELLLVSNMVVTTSVSRWETSELSRRSALCDIIIVLTMSLYSFSLVYHRARAHRRPLVTAVTPCGLTGPEENPTSRPQPGFTLALEHTEGKKCRVNLSLNEVALGSEVTHCYFLCISVSEKQLSSIKVVIQVQDGTVEKKTGHSRSPVSSWHSLC